MKFAYLSETVSIKRISETNTEGIFEIEGLYTGYGLTLGNALRRVLLSSLPGAAITQVKIKGVGHEFTTIPNVTEDVVEIMLNLKRVRFRLFSEEPQVLTLKVKGEAEVTAADIKTNAEVEVINPDAYICALSAKSADLEMELTVEQGLGYVPAETSSKEKLPVGVIALDAIFSPVVKVNYSVENMRVGDRTDFNRLRLSVATDGSVTPSNALRKAISILQDHLGKIALLEVQEIEEKTKRKKSKE